MAVVVGVVGVVVVVDLVDNKNKGECVYIECIKEEECVGSSSKLNSRA